MEIWAIWLLVSISAFALNIALAIFGGKVTEERGYGFARGFIVVFTAPFIGLIGVFNLEDRNGKELMPSSPGLKGKDKREQRNITKGMVQALKEVDKDIDKVNKQIDKVK